MELFLHFPIRLLGVELRQMQGNVTLFHVKSARCHNGMARPQVADGRNGLHIWRVAANILNKDGRTRNKGWASSVLLLK
jgi:hypothetical protein